MSAKDETIQKNEEDFGMPSDAIETLEQVAQAFGVQPDTVIKWALLDPDWKGELYEKVLPEGEKTQDEDYHFPVGTIGANREYFNQPVKTTMATLLKENAELRKKAMDLLLKENADIVKKVIEVFQLQPLILEPPLEELPFA